MSSASNLEIEWSERVNEAVNRAIAVTATSASKRYDERTANNLADTANSVSDARRLLDDWSNSESSRDIYQDLNLAALETITHVDPNQVSSAGDFVRHG